MLKRTLDKSCGTRVDPPDLTKGSEVRLSRRVLEVGAVLGHGKYARVFTMYTRRGDIIAAKVHENLSYASHEFACVQDLRNRRTERGGSLAAWYLPEELYFYEGGACRGERRGMGAVMLMPSRVSMPSLAVCHHGGEVLAAVVTHDLLGALLQLHTLGFLHGDVKPDNFVLAASVGPEGLSELGLPWTVMGLDLGRSIDLELQPTAAFVSDCHVEPYRCPEMDKANLKPWTYHIDAYGAACIAYGVLAGKWFKMPVHRSGSRWELKGAIRPAPDALWKQVFDDLLNSGEPAKGSSAGRSRSLANFQRIRTCLAEFVQGRKDEAHEALSKLQSSPCVVPKEE